MPLAAVGIPRLVATSLLGPSSLCLLLRVSSLCLLYGHSSLDSGPTQIVAETPHLKILHLVTFSNTLVPSEVTFTGPGSEAMHESVFLWGPLTSC